MEETLTTPSSRQELWQSRISAYRSSGLTAKAWCDQNNVSISSLRYWITRFNKTVEEESAETEDTIFARLPTEAEIITMSPSVPAVIVAGGLRIELSADCPHELLGTLIRILRSNA